MIINLIPYKVGVKMENFHCSYVEHGQKYVDFCYDFKE